MVVYNTLDFMKPALASDRPVNNEYDQRRQNLMKTKGHLLISIFGAVAFAVSAGDQSALAKGKDNDPVEEMFKAIGADDGDKRSAVMGSIIEAYEQGGNEVYDLKTGRIIRVFPPSLKKAMDDKESKSGGSLTPEEDEKFRQAYIGLYAKEHSPAYMKKWRTARTAVTEHQKFQQFTTNELFKGDIDLLAYTIAREYALGGLEQPVKKKGTARKLPDNVKTIDEFVDYLLERLPPQDLEAPKAARQ